MKKIINLVTLIVLCLTSLQTIQAQTFKGTLSNVKMNDKTYNNVNDVTFTLTKQHGDTYSLTSSPIGPIGKMPGTINVNATVLIDSLGQISPDFSTKKAGTLNLKAGGSLSLNMKNISGNKKNNSINFILDTYSLDILEILGIEAMRASVTFDGTKVSN